MPAVAMMPDSRDCTIRSGGKSASADRCGFQQGAFVTLSAGKAVMSLASLSVSGVGSLSAGGQRTEQDEKCS